MKELGFLFVTQNRLRYGKQKGITVTAIVAYVHKKSKKGAIFFVR